MSKVNKIYSCISKIPQNPGLPTLRVQFNPMYQDCQLHVGIYIKFPTSKPDQIVITESKIKKSVPVRWEEI